MSFQKKPQNTQTHNPERKQLSQEELCDFLIAKLRNFKNVNITTRPIENARGICYGIDVKNYTLGNLGNGVFHSLSMRTVSHTSRVINIKLVFNDNEKRNADMKVNADALMQIYREISNTTKPNGELNKTLENVHIDEFEDERGNKHLAVIGESTKGASLIYTYLRTMDFIRVINDKYSNEEVNEDGIEDDIEITDDMTDADIDAKTKILEQKLKALTELRAAQKSAAPTNPIDTADAAADTAVGTAVDNTNSKKNVNIVVEGKVIKKYNRKNSSK